jgi:Zn2+/Cd2+-exporting ATPase
MKKRFFIKFIPNEATIMVVNEQLHKKYPHYTRRTSNDLLQIEVNVKENRDQDVVFQALVDLCKQINPQIVVEEVELKNQRRVLILDNLDCANCAAKIERIAKRTFDHEMISVDFAATRFIIETSDQDLLANLTDEVQQICDMVDDDIHVTTVKTQKRLETESIKIDPTKKRNFIIGFCLFAVGFIVKTFLNQIEFQYQWITLIIIYVMYSVGYVILAYDVLLGAFKNIKAGRVFDEKFLMSLATIVALFIGKYDEALMVMIFYKIGDLLQQYAVNYSRKSIRSLMNIQPHVANIESNGGMMEVDPSQVVVNDVVLINPGDKIPLDGQVIEGIAHLDVSALTGESILKEVGPKDLVLSGSICEQGNLRIRVTKAYQDSMVSKIMDLVENASSNKSRSEHFISKFAKYYTPTVVILAVIIAILLPFISPRYTTEWVGGFQESILTALIFLVVSCPCALVISIPLGFFGGIGSASKHGILVKGSNYLEALNQVDTVVFDKTGTLTKGKFVVNEIVSCSDYSQSDILKFAAYAESTSNHPIARSIIQAYQEAIDPTKVEFLKNPSLHGVNAKVQGTTVAVGKVSYLKGLNIDVDEKVSQDNGGIIHVAIRNQYAGYISIRDEMKEDVRATVRELKRIGIKKVIMLTGDQEQIAQEIAKDAGLDQYYANMNPIDKVQRLTKLKILQQANKKIAFVGDGINDAPVLSIADVGIAMGAMGSDAAVEVADIVLMTDELKKIPLAIRIARKTRRIVMQNIVLALTVKFLVLAVAPLNILNYLIYEAIFADVGVSILAILNALRILRIDK